MGLARLCAVEGLPLFRIRPKLHLFSHVLSLGKSINQIFWVHCASKKNLSGSVGRPSPLHRGVIWQSRLKHCKRTIASVSMRSSA